MLTETVTQTKHCKEVVFSIESRPATVMRYNGALQIMLILFIFHFITGFPPFLVWLPSYRLLGVVRSWVHACVLSLVWLSATPRTVCSPLGSSVHGISQTGTLEWVAISFSRGFFWPRDLTWVSCIGRRILYHWASWIMVLFPLSKNFKDQSTV